MVDNPDADYERILGGKDPIEALNELSLTVHEHYYDVGCILYHLKDGDGYKTIDGNFYYSEKHSKWKQFCEDKLTISYRTAQYWLNLYRYFLAMDIGRDKLQLLGWSKAKELIDVTEDAAKLDEIIAAAETMTLNELRAYIANYKVSIGKDTRETVDFKKFSHSLPMAQAEHAEEIIKAAMRETNGDQNEAFWKILVEWHQFTNPIPDVDYDTYLVSTETEGELVTIG